MAMVRVMMKAQATAALAKAQAMVKPPLNQTVMFRAAMASAMVQEWATPPLNQKGTDRAQTSA